MNLLAQSLSRLGTESAFEVLARAEQLASDGNDIINLGIGQPDFKTAPHIVEGAIQALRDGHHGYTPANGIKLFRETIAIDIERRHGVEVDPNNVIVVPGGKVTMFFSILMFGEPGVEILYPNPGFPIYESVINFTGAKAIPIPLIEDNGFSFCAEEVLELIKPNTRLLILNSPANPTGGCIQKDQLDLLAKGLEKKPQVTILSDEIYSQILYDEHQHISLLNYENLRERVIILDGFSKTYAMTGWRLGYSVWPKKLVEPATRLAINCHSCVNAAIQYAGIAALNGTQNEVRNMVEVFDERRKLMITELNALPGIKCVNPSGAFYAFANVKGTGLTSSQAENKFLSEAGVATIAGSSFGSFGEGYVRFSYANSTANIRKAINRIALHL